MPKFQPLYRTCTKEYSMLQIMQFAIPISNVVENLYSRICIRKFVLEDVYSNICYNSGDSLWTESGNLSHA